MTFYRQPPNRQFGGGVRLAVPGLTPVVKLIIIICVAVWALQLIMAWSGINLGYYLGAVPILVVFKGYIWQPFTYMFLHSIAGIWHLALNMLILWMFGGELERYWGSRAFLRYYLVCGVGAGLFITVLGFLADPAVITVGASGAIYGLILAYGMIFANRVVLFMMIIPMKARTLAIILFAINFLSSMGPNVGNVSHVAHLGGMVVGFLYLKRAWRLGDFYREMRWKLLRRRYKVVPPDDKDRWIN